MGRRRERKGRKKKEMFLLLFFLCGVQNGGCPNRPLSPSLSLAKFCRSLLLSLPPLFFFWLVVFFCSRGSFGSCWLSASKRLGAARRRRRKRRGVKDNQENLKKGLLSLSPLVHSSTAAQEAFFCTKLCACALLSSWAKLLFLLPPLTSLCPPALSLSLFQRRRRGKEGRGKRP